MTKISDKDLMKALTARLGPKPKKRKPWSLAAIDRAIDASNAVAPEQMGERAYLRHLHGMEPTPKIRTPPAFIEPISTVVGHVRRRLAATFAPRQEPEPETLARLRPETAARLLAEHLARQKRERAQEAEEQARERIVQPATRGATGPLSNMYEHRKLY